MNENHARLFAACVLGYAFSPVDLIAEWNALAALAVYVVVPFQLPVAHRSCARI